MLLLVVLLLSSVCERGVVVRMLLCGYEWRCVCLCICVGHSYVCGVVLL